VNLRCAQLFRNQAFLYLGGGLTAQSNVEEEWQETENKAKTLEKIFQLTSFT
jgi:isochorismate synthase